MTLGCDSVVSLMSVLDEVSRCQYLTFGLEKMLVVL